MAQPQMGPITCSQCGALYHSEKELQGHMKASHHEGPAQNKVAPRRHNAGKDGSKFPSR